MSASDVTLDPSAGEALLKPWPLYSELREMGPVVWLEKYGMSALTRYDAVAKALRDDQITRLKLVRRQMYGRGKIDLLQARLIGAE